MGVQQATTVRRRRKKEIRRRKKGKGREKGTIGRWVVEWPTAKEWMGAGE